MYTLVLFLHSWLRWAVLIAGFGAVATSLSSRPPGTSDPADRWGLAFMATLDLQMLLGLLLYFALSPTTAAIFNNFDTAMQDPVARFWAVEHIGTMTLAVVMAHIGRALARKATTASGKRTRLLVCFGISLIAILAAIRGPAWRQAERSSAAYNRRFRAHNRRSRARLGRAGRARCHRRSVDSALRADLRRCRRDRRRHRGAALLDVPVQVLAFGIVTVLSFAALRRRFMTRFGAQGVPSRTEPLWHARRRDARHRSGDRHRTRECRRRRLGRASPGAARAAGTKSASLAPTASCSRCRLQ